MACPWSAPISSRATPPPASATGNRSTSRPMTASPSGPPSRARLGSKVRRPGQRGHRVVSDVGQVGQHEVEALAVRPVRQQVGDREADPVGDRVADGVLACEIERIRGDVDGEDLDRLERPELAEPDGQRDRDRAAPGPDVHDPERRGGRLIAGQDTQPAHDLGLRELDQALRLRSRDQRSRIRLEREPVELLEPAQVRDGLAGGAALEIGSVAAGRVRPDRCVVVGDHGRPAHPDRVPEEQLGIEPWRLGSCGGQPLGALAQEGPGRAARPAPGRTGTVRRPCHRRRGGRPGRP